MNVYLAAVALCGDGKEQLAVRQNQTVSEMAEEVLARHAKALVARSGRSFEAAMEAVADTDAGQQLKELANSEHREQLAEEWQASLLWRRAEERHYSWLESYVERLEGKEARADYDDSWRRNSLA